jgi:hypothetical protein
MHSLYLSLLAVVLIAGCSGPHGVSKQDATHEAVCKTHATRATYGKTPDVNSAYLECLHTSGIHEVEVREIK